MNVAFLLLIILAIVIIFVIAIFTKSIIKTIAAIITFSIIASLVIGFLIYKDAQDIQQNFMTKTNTIVLTDNTNILTGLVIGKDQPSFLTDQQVIDYAAYYQQKNLDLIKGSSYKLFLIDIDIINKIEEDTIDMDGIKFTKQETINILKSDNPKNVLVSKIAEKEGIPAEQVVVMLAENPPEGIDFDNKAQLKAMFFGKSMFYIIEPENPVDFLMLYKSGDMEIYPETIAFKAIKIIPKSLIERLISSK